MNSGKLVNHQRVKTQDSRARPFVSSRRGIPSHPTKSYRESFTYVFCNPGTLRDLWFDRTNIRYEYGKEKKKGELDPVP
jgi:hypothetical protein